MSKLTINDASESIIERRPWNSGRKQGLLSSMAHEIRWNQSCGRWGTRQDGCGCQSGSRLLRIAVLAENTRELLKLAEAAFFFVRARLPQSRVSRLKLAHTGRTSIVKCQDKRRFVSQYSNEVTRQQS